MRDLIKNVQDLSITRFVWSQHPWAQACCTLPSSWTIRSTSWTDSSPNDILGRFFGLESSSGVRSILNLEYQSMRRLFQSDCSIVFRFVQHFKNLGWWRFRYYRKPHALVILLLASDNLRERERESVKPVDESNHRGPKVCFHFLSKTSI